MEIKIDFDDPDKSIEQLTTGLLLVLSYKRGKMENMDDFDKTLEGPLQRAVKKYATEKDI